VLFDSIDRDDPSPCRELEDSFSFLNRVDTPFWAEVRALLERWFERYPDSEKDHLQSAFRSRLPGQHYAAWWELYLHELFLRLGYEITIHPPLPDSSKTPDFLLRQDDAQIYVEAAILFSGISGRQDSGAPPWMLEAINDVTSPNFFLALSSVQGRGGPQLKRKEIIEPLEAWLERLDPDAVSSTNAQEGRFPQETIKRRGWEMTFEAIPVKPAARGKSRRTLGVMPMQAGWVDDIQQLVGTLKKKAGRYGRPKIPLVTAVHCLSAFMEPLDIEQALFGREAFQIPANSEEEARLVRQRNGFWITGDGPQNQRVSAVLMGVTLHPHNVGKVAPTLWRSPWANHPLEELWPFSEFTATAQGEILRQERSPNMAELFGLSEDWPGGEPFPRG